MQSGEFAYEIFGDAIGNFFQGSFDLESYFGEDGEEIIRVEASLYI